MKHTSYNEQRQRGNFSFPVEYHYVTNRHPRYHMPYHWHIQYEIIRVLQGNIFISVDEEKYTVKQGEILFIPDGAIHGGKSFLENTIYECMVFDKKLFETDVGESGMLQKFFDHQILINKHYTNEQTVIKEIVWLMFRTLKNQYEGFEYIVKGSILAFFGLVLKNKLYTVSLTNFINNNQRNIYKLKKVFNLIEKSYNTPLTLEKLALAADLSPKYFCRFFQNITNKSPISYLNYYRIECACTKLINEPDISITDIAYDCGFNDLSYFIKTFRKYKGITPNKYIKLHEQLNQKK